MNLYRTAWERHRDARTEAYEAARDDAITHAGLGAEIRLADIDDAALEVWARSWARRKHPTGTGGWNWPELVRALPSRAAVLPLAIWYGTDLCGLALGHASRSRAGGVRHTFTLTFVERRAEPPPVPLRGHIVSLAVAAAQSYGARLGASRLVLRNPDRNLLPFSMRRWALKLLGRTENLCTANGRSEMSEKSAPVRRSKLRIRRSRSVSRQYDAIPAPSREVARARIRGKPGFYESLSDEARKLLDSYDGPENIGPSM